MPPMQFELGDRLRLRKPHPCGRLTNGWLFAWGPISVCVACAVGGVSSCRAQRLSAAHVKFSRTPLIQAFLRHHPEKKARGKTL